MIGQLERSHLDRVELGALHVDLKDRRNAADRSELLGHRVVDDDVLDIKGPIDGVVNIPITMGNVNRDITPTLLPEPLALFGGYVRAGLSEEQASERSAQVYQRESVG